MTTYMGPNLGAMVPVECLTDLSVTPSTGVAQATNLAGARRIYVDPPESPALRVWSGSIDITDPEAMATLVELESMRTSLRMITDSAAVNNLFPPAAAIGPTGWLPSASTLTQGGPQSLQSPSRFTASSVAITSTTATVFSPLFPVIPGVRVSGSIHVLAVPGESGRVALDWMAADAGQGQGALSTPDSDSTTQTGPGAPYLTVGAIPPLGVYAARLRLTGVARFARPAVTWTDQVQPWRPGEGAECVHLSPLTQSVITAWSDGYSHSSSQYTVTEATA